MRKQTLPGFRRLLPRLTVLFMLTGAIAFPVNASDAAPLKEAGLIEDAGKALSFTGQDGLMVREDGDLSVFCDENGKEFPELAFSRCEHLTGDIWELSRQGEEVPESALVKSDGTVLIPWGLNVIKLQNEHYVDVIFGEEQTDSKEEALMYVSPNMFTMGFPGDEDVLYKGKRQLYDLDGEKLLEDVVFTAPSQEFTVCGSTYLVNDRTNPPRILDASGKVLLDDAGGIWVTDCYYSQRSDGKLYVYDDRMNRIAESDQADSIVEGGFFDISDEDSTHGILSFDGSIQIEPQYSFAPRTLKGGLFKVTRKDNSGNYCYGLIDQEGNSVLEPDCYTVEELEGDGYIYAKKTSDSETTLLFAPDGRLISDKISGYPHSSLSAELEDKQYVILNTGGTLDLSDYDTHTPIGTALLAARNIDTHKYGLFEMYDGTRLLDDEWDDVRCGYGNIYAWKDGAWHVFEWK